MTRFSEVLSPDSIQILPNLGLKSLNLVTLNLKDMREDLNHNDFADDAAGAKKATEVHNDIKRKILKIPIENIDNIGQRLLQR